MFRLCQLAHTDPSSLSTLTAYAVSYYMPIILNLQLGYSIEASQLLTTPPYIFGGILMCVEGWLCDRWRVRSPVIIYNSIQSIVGLCVMSWTKNSGVQYLGVFLVSSGSSANFPAVMAWQANNIRGHWTRSFCSALLTSMGGLGGIIGALVFRSQDAPKYIPGVATCILYVSSNLRCPNEPKEGGNKLTTFNLVRVAS